MVTRSDIYPRIALELGGHAGNIASGNATSAVLTGLIGNTFDSVLVDDRLYMPDAATVADSERTLTGWTGSSGTAAWAGNRSDTTYSNETWFLLPAGYGYSLADIQAAIDETLRQTRHAVRNVIPLVENRRQYALTDFPWITDSSLVTGVTRRSSPGLLDNESFDLWTNNPGASAISANPTSWTLAGASGKVFRAASTQGYGPYQASLLEGGSDVTLTQTVGLLDFQLVGKTIAGSMTCTAANASSLRLAISDGITTTYSSYHTGGSTPETLTLSKEIAATATTLTVFPAQTVTATESIHRVLAQEGSAIDTRLQDHGSDYFREQSEDYRVRTIGGVPTIVLNYFYGRQQQLVVSSTAPYAALSTDAAVSDIPADVLEQGTLYHLLSKSKPNQDRTRLDGEMFRHGSAYRRLTNRLLDDPAPDAQARVVVRGA